ncbi:uncharacterized protein LOC105662692 isoform X2 [Megachile rotundata]|uniref:uncharacterized protein LOC105662692 isoform X2 n=1 Tax=Megachile rotundata TaxID=143995 RepID=UPI003FCF7E55
MDAVEIQERYLKITKRYLVLGGIWPTQKKSAQYIYRVIIYIVMVPTVLAQLARVIWFFDMTTLLQQLSFFLAMVLLLIKQAAYIINDAKFKALLDGMYNDWKKDRTKEEIAIMISYMDRGAFYSSIYIASAYFAMMLFLQMPWWPRVADILMPLNASRPRGYIFPAYYYVDDDKYYYWIIAYSSIATIITVCGYIACDIYFIYAVQHACGLFTVAGHRFKKAIHQISDKRKIPQMSNETHRNVCRSIMAHDRAITYAKAIDDFYYGILFIVVGMTIGAFSSTLFWLSKMKPCAQFYEYIVFLTIQLLHIFFLAIQGQFMINRTDIVYNQIYEGQWYNSVPKTQELFILALRTAMNPPQITAGGVIAMNLQTFAEVVKVSFSYYTVLQTV